MIVKITKLPLTVEAWRMTLENEKVKSDFEKLIAATAQAITEAAQQGKTTCSVILANHELAAQVALAHQIRNLGYEGKLVGSCVEIEWTQSEPPSGYRAPDPRPKGGQDRIR